MKTLAVVSAAALLAVGLAATAEAAPSVRLSSAPPLAQKAGCWDACEYYLEALQEAREEAREAAEEAAEYAAEEAEEYGYRPRRRSRRQTHIAPKPRAVQKAAAAEAPPKTSEKKSDVAVNAAAGCKQYSPATGMVLSVPCE